MMDNKQTIEIKDNQQGIAQILSTNKGELLRLPTKEEGKDELVWSGLIYRINDNEIYGRNIWLVGGEHIFTTMSMDELHELLSKNK